MTEWNRIVLVSLLLSTVAVHGAGAQGQEVSNAELAKRAQNPVASLISLPFQNNTSFQIGPYDRTQNVLNIQPVIPVAAGKNLNIINRIILPLVSQPDISQTSGSTFGLGPTSYTAFFSPAAAGAVTWGVGPAVQIPTASKDELGSDQWGLGPSGVIVVTTGKWVLGTVTNNVWSLGGSEDGSDYNKFLLQYFINYNLPNAWYLTSAPIITADWNAASGNQWIVPFGAGGGKIFAIGKQRFNGNVSAFWNAVHPDTAPYPKWTLRVQLALLFPK